jgi:SAM-dependent methyltransferase
MTQGTLDGLDHAFLRYIGVVSENQQQIQSFYLPFFSACRQVLDLGCGDGDFVQLLQDRGIEAWGVDSDPLTVATALNRGRRVVQGDVFSYLHDADASSVDGIFCAHLVEHLPYDRVVELIAESFRVLRPGGRLVLATPDVRTLFSHLEMFYLHFGHVSFYHPRLLCFFLDHARFQDVEYGVNPTTSSPMMPGLRAGPKTGQASWARRGPDGVPLRVLREIPQQGKGLGRALSYRIKRKLAQWLVLPFVDQLADNMAELQQDIDRVAAALDSLNGPFECYATGCKPGS